MDYYYFFEHEVNVQKLKWRGSQGIGLCPLPAHDDTHPSFSCCGETGLWNCFGCGEKGNAYLLALETNMRNPRQYIDDSTTYSKHYTTNGYEPKITLKGEDKESDEAEIVQKYEDLKKKYGDRVTLGHQYKDKYVGKDDNGDTVFIYPNGIKVHKKYWVKNASSDTSNQIFMVDELDGFDKTKPLYIFEGEKDALISPLQGISFSSGCSAIPKNIKVIYAFGCIIIVYDNDKYGKRGAEKLANRIKKESHNTIVKIAQWDTTLPNGYDVYDDRSTGFEKVDEAITNAIEYKKTDLETNDKEKEVKGFQTMKPNELIESSPEPPKAIVENLLVEKGVTIISGTDGVGKTWFGLQMAVAIASGESILGWEVNQKPVLMIQFELSSAQLSSRLKKYDLDKTKCQLLFTVMKDEDLIFTDSWGKIAQTIADNDFYNGVVIIDNLYTSTNVNVSENSELKPLLKTINHIKNVSNNAFILFAHHNKYDDGKEPTLGKNIITGGKTLTNYASNVFQIGTSSMGADVRRGKITKMRDYYSELLNEPLRLGWSPKFCTFEYEGIIINEKLHTVQIESRWEYTVLIEFAKINSDEPKFDRPKIQRFMEGHFKDDTPNNVSTKTTRWLNKMVEWKLIKKIKYNSYKLQFDQIKLLNIE